MKKILCLTLTLIVMFSSLFGCNNVAGKVNIQIKDGYTRYDIKENNGRKLEGFGAQMDTDMFLPSNNLTAKEEEMIATRVKDMKLQYTRIKMFPEFFERGNDNDDPKSFDVKSKNVDFNSIEMQALYKVLDICQQNNMRIDLSWYGCNGTFKSADGLINGSWLGYPQSVAPGWVSAPRIYNYDSNGAATTDFDGYNEMAENIIACIDFLINEKKYTCITGFSIICEAFHVWDGSISWAEYVKCCKIVNQRLIEKNLRDKISFIGPSDSGMNKVNRFKNNLKDLDNINDSFSIGNYNWDAYSPVDYMENFFDSYVEVCDEYKHNLGLAEFGTKNLTNPVIRSDIDDYDAGMYMAKLMIQCINSGLTYMNYYILCDTYFGSYVHRLGLWQYRTEDWKAHPAYYFWALICQFSQIGAEIYPITFTDSDVLMIAFRMKNGEWSYMLANNSDITKKIAIVNDKANRPKELKQYKITESIIPENRECSLINFSATIESNLGVANVILQPNSFTVLSNMAR